MGYYYCVQCGWIGYKTARDFEEQKNCYYCKSELYKINEDIEHVNSLSETEYNDWKKRVFVKYICRDERFSKNKADKRLLREMKKPLEEERVRSPRVNSSEYNKSASPPEVRCPKCNSTQIQAVTRKWSLLTGFLTNKVDRVCLNCKNKF